MKRMLIVDDSISWRRHHEETVKHLYGDEFEITLASSASEANDIIYGDIPYDVILTDMQMESDYLPLYAGNGLSNKFKR